MASGSDRRRGGPAAGDTCLAGIGASPGIAIGKASCLDRRRLKVAKFHVGRRGSEREVERFTAAHAQSVAQLAEIVRRIEDSHGADHYHVVEAHKMMLEDQVFVAEVEEVIRRDEINAEWAISRVLRRFKETFGRLVTSDYLDERRTDVDFVGDRILRNMQRTDVEATGQIPDEAIIIAHDLSPADTALLIQRRVRAIVCEVGGPTSHIAIVARSLEIPAVLGVEGVTEQAGDGDTVIVDGGAGQVLLTPDAQVLARYRGLRRAARHAARVVHDERDRPAVTLDGFHVAVRANIELVDELPTVLEHGTEGVGLYRTEFLYIGRDELPGVDEQYENYRRVVEKVAPELVTIRTIDIGSEKLARSLPIDPEPNPALGLRAIRFCLKRPDIFRAQLRAILMASAHGPVRILLPMISSVEELREARALLDAVKGDLRTDGLPFDPHVKLGVMIELPSACVIADLLARECDFFSLGTNDLIQYALAVDRNNEHLTHLYQPFHPAVLRMIAEVVAAGHAQHIPVGMCGEMAGDPAVLPLLLAFGLDELSMAAVAAPRIKREVRTLGLDECRALWQQVRRLATAAEIEAATRAFHEARAAAGGEP